MTPLEVIRTGLAGRYGIDRELGQEAWRPSSSRTAFVTIATSP